MTCLDMSGHVEIIVQHCAIHKTINSCHTILDINSVFSKIEEITWEKKILWKHIKSYQVWTCLYQNKSSHFAETYNFTSDKYRHAQ